MSKAYDFRCDECGFNMIWWNCKGLINECPNCGSKKIRMPEAPSWMVFRFGSSRNLEMLMETEVKK